MWGESISGGRGEARRVGRRDCSTRKARCEEEVSRWTNSVDVASGTYSCPASMSARLVVHLQSGGQIVPGAELSWRARSHGRCHGLTGLGRANDVVNK